MIFIGVRNKRGRTAKIRKNDGQFEVVIRLDFQDRLEIFPTKKEAVAYIRGFQDALSGLGLDLKYGPHCKQEQNACDPEGIMAQEILSCLRAARSGRIADD